MRCSWEEVIIYHIGSFVLGRCPFALLSTFVKLCGYLSNKNITDSSSQVSISVLKDEKVFLIYMLVYSDYNADKIIKKRAFVETNSHKKDILCRGSFEFNNVHPSEGGWMGEKGHKKGLCRPTTLESTHLPPSHQGGNSYFSVGWKSML